MDEKEITNYIIFEGVDIVFNHIIDEINALEPTLPLMSYVTKLFNYI